MISQATISALVEAGVQGAQFGKIVELIERDISFAKRALVRDPLSKRLAYVQGILRNRFECERDRDLIPELVDIHEWGISVDEMEEQAKVCSSFYDMWETLAKVAQARISASKESPRGKD